MGIITNPITKAMTAKPDIDLIPLQKIRAGDNDAFNEIFTRYEKTIFNLIRSIVGNYHDSEDLTMETFTKVYLKIRTFIPNFLFKTWLITIATNTALDFIRAKKRRQAIIKDIDVLIPFIENKDPDPWQEMVSKESMIFIRKAIKCLPENDRQAIIREIHNFVPRDVMNRARLFRARKQLKKLIA